MAERSENQKAIYDDGLWGLLLILLVVVSYLPVAWAGYLWDDDVNLTANPCIIGPLGLKEIWTTSAADICPLVRTTFWLEHALWGLAPLPYHVVNVLLHAAGAVALWRVLRSLSVPGAWLGAALWALHPVQVESVAWTTEMKNTESGLFFLLSILFFGKWVKAGGPTERSGSHGHYALALLFAALAMASKPSTVILPLVWCLCAWWLEGRWQWRNLVRTAPVFLMALVASAVAVWVVKLSKVGVDLGGTRTGPERLVTAGKAVWFYLGKLAWPHPLSAVYPRWVIEAHHATSYLPLLGVMVVFSVLWLGRASRLRPWFFAFAYFLAALLPVIGLVDHDFFAFSYVGDHFQYLASMGPLALLGAGLARGAEFVLPGKTLLPATLGAGLLLVLALLTWQRACIYENEETLWTDTLKKNPNCWMGYYDLGVVFAGRNQMDEAISLFHKSLALYPLFAATHYNLGKALEEKGETDAAIVEYQKALDLDPASTATRDNLANALVKMGRVDEALIQYRKTLEIDPNFAEAYDNLGDLLLRQGQMDEAMAMYEKALALNPEIAGAHYNFGNALVQKGRVDEARAEFQKALEINPDFAEAHFALGVVLAQSRQVDEARLQLQKTLEINPRFAEAHFVLGIIYEQKGQVDEAIREYQNALAINPNFVKAQASLAKAQAMARPSATSHGK